MNKQKIAVLIPAHNEEKVIARTIESVLKVLDRSDIYLVNDGSVDNTDVIARRYLDNVLTLTVGHGKAEGTNRLIQHFEILNNYEYFMPIDADTKITEDFIQKALPILEQDSKHEIACVVGKVTGVNHNWITSFRIWEYEIAQTVHKSAQSYENAIIICPGCATIYRSEIMHKVEIPSGTLTEDMDLTFLIHRKKMGKIKYVGSAKVVTQDPATLTDFTKQLFRWYTGFWQCLIKHNVPWGGQLLDLEVGLIAVEGLFNGALVLFFLFVLPFVIHQNSQILLIPAAIDFFLFLLPTLIYTGIKNKIYNILLFIPHFYFLRFLSSFVFLYCFLRIVLSLDLSMKWHKVVRY